MSRVDLIVSTYNQPKLLDTCLHFLKQQTYSDFRLIVADDHSIPPAREIVRAHYPDACIVRSKKNVGLVRSLNAALRAADSEFVVLLNDDTEPEPSWLESLVTTAESSPDAGSVASKFLIHGTERTIHSAGDGFTVWGMPVNRGVWLPDLGQYDSATEIFGACGGAALYRRSALNDVRLPNGDIFDSSLFMYCEDVDLAWRLQLAGHRCAFAPQAVVRHHLSATGGGTLASYYVSRNVLCLLGSTVSRQFLAQYWRRVVAHQAGRFWRNCKHLGEPAARASIRGTLAGAARLGVNLTHSGPAAPSHQLEYISTLLIDRQ